MGMYTELFINARINANADQKDLEVLKYLFSGGDMPDTLPDHTFFKTDRWDMIGRSGSYYFQPEPTSIFRKDRFGDLYYLLSRSDLKNYDNEIEKFIDWIKPKIDAEEGNFIGYTRYEEDQEPTIIYK